LVLIYNIRRKVMRKDKKTITVLISSFIIVFFISLVFAAATGRLSLGGSAVFLEYNIINLHIVDATVINGEENDAISISLDGHTLAFSLLLKEAGNSKVVEFYIENVGNQPAILGQLQTNNPPPQQQITVTWPTSGSNMLEGTIIEPGDTVGPFTITTTWNAGQASITTSTSFSATISFEQYIEE
jgi:hypothetical protein